MRLTSARSTDRDVAIRTASAAAPRQAPIDGTVPSSAEIVCHDLARLASTDEGYSMFLLMARLADGGGSGAEALLGPRKPRAREQEAAGRVGIWAPRSTNGRTSFVRTTSNEDTFWADVACIEPKGARTRVVLFGESAARGYFYDPHYQPARVLESMLNDRGDSDVEVVDLARTSLGFRPLVDLMQAALALEPDLYVMLAGNNWYPYSRMGWADARRIVMMLRDGAGWGPVRAHMEARQHARVRTLIEQLATLAASRRIPIVVLIPEFNLADWHDVGRELPFLSGERLALWVAVRGALGEAVARGDRAAAESLALELTTLDEHTMPLGLEVLADCRRQAGDLAGARRYREMARDCELAFPGASPPRCFGITQESLRREARARELTVVDLPRRFEEHLNGDLPGRTLFLDYCHLTFDGIRLAMAWAAEAILPLLGRPQVPWRRLAEQARPPRPRVLAMASLLAAHHNYQTGQSGEIVRYHCEQAIAADPGIRETLQQFVDFHTRRAPSLVCRSFDAFAQAERAVTEYYLNPVHVDKHTKLPFIDTLLDILGKTDAAVPPRVLDVRTREHGVCGRRLNLLDSLYRSSSAAMDLGVIARPKSAYYTSFYFTSTFFVVCQRPTDIVLTLTYRVPAQPLGAGDVRVSVNGSWTGTLTASRRWRSIALTVPADHTREGANSIEVRWPLPDRSWQEAIDATAARVDREPASAMYSIYPVFGEIAAFAAAAPAPTSGAAS